MFILMHTSEWFKKKRLSRIDGLQDERKSIIISDSIKAMQTYQQNHMMPICSTISFSFPLTCFTYVSGVPFEAKEKSGFT